MNKRNHTAQYTSMIGTRGQVTIFIIVSIIIVFGVLIVLFLKPGPKVELPVEKSPSDFVKDCVEEAVEDSVGILMQNGGQISPNQTIFYKGEIYNYLCYQADYYQSCYNLYPILEVLIEREIKQNTLDKVQNCFNSLRIDFEDQGYSVSGSPASYSLDLVPGSIDISLRKKITLQKGDFSQTFENFDGAVLSPLYDLVRVSRDIVNNEAQFCNFEYNGYMLLYPQYDISRIDNEGSKLYSVIDRRTNEKFKFAVRSCVMAPGI